MPAQTGRTGRTRRTRRTGRTRRFAIPYSAPGQVAPDGFSSIPASEFFLLILRKTVQPLQDWNMEYSVPRDSLALIARAAICRLRVHDSTPFEGRGGGAAPHGYAGSGAALSGGTGATGATGATGRVALASPRAMASRPVRRACRVRPVRRVRRVRPVHGSVVRLRSACLGPLHNRPPDGSKNRDEPGRGEGIVCKAGFW